MIDLAWVLFYTNMISITLLIGTPKVGHINKTHFPAIFKEAFEQTMTLATIKNAFTKTGIFQFNLDVIDKSIKIPSNPGSSNLPIPRTTNQISTLTILRPSQMTSYFQSQHQCQCQYQVQLQHQLQIQLKLCCQLIRDKLTIQHLC